MRLWLCEILKIVHKYGQDNKASNVLGDINGDNKN